MLETLIRKRYIVINLIPTTHTKMKKVVKRKLLSSSFTAYQFYFCVYLLYKKNTWIRVCTTCVFTLILKYSL